MSYQDTIDRDVRLIILRALADAPDYSLNSNILGKILAEFGHTVTRDYVHNQLGWLKQSAGAVTTEEKGSLEVATITRAGLDHVELRHTLSGVDRPGPGV